MNTKALKQKILDLAIHGKLVPQNPDDQWNKELPERDYNEFMNSYLHTIGNLTLSGNNGALGNKTFNEKK